MPPVVIAAIGAGLGAYVLGATITAALWTAAANLVLGLAAQALAPKPQAPSLGDATRGYQTLVRMTAAPHRVIYGEAVASGVLVFAATSDSNNEYLHLVVALAGHECSAVSDIWLNDTLYTDPRFAGLVQINVHLGTSGQTVDTDLMGAVPEWTATHRLRGITYLYVRLKWNADVWISGIPNIRAKVRGRIVWDPRLGIHGNPAAWAWTQNAALAQLDYLMADFGVAAQLSEIHGASWIAAVSVCDEHVDLEGGGWQYRYQANGLLTLDQSPISNMEKLLTASAGSLVYQQGAYRGYAGAWVAPTVTLDESDLRGDVEVRTMPSRKDRFNAVRGQFVDPERFWEACEFPPVTNAFYEGEDGGRLYHDIELPFTSDNIAAQRIAKIQLERHRQGIIVKYPAKVTAFGLAAWDTVKITNALLGWNQKYFRVLEWKLAEDGGIDLLLGEDASAVYDWDEGEETAYDPAPDTDLPNPWDVAAITGLALQSGTAHLFLAADGTVHSRIYASWNPPTNQFVLSGGFLHLQYKRAAAGTWTDGGHVGADVTSAYIAPVQDAIAYDVRIHAVNRAGVAGAWATVTGHVVIGKTEPPSDVAWFLAVQNGSVVVFRWSQVTDLDLAGYEIRYAPQGTAEWDSALVLTSVTRGTTVTDASLPPGAWTALIKARDTSGNYSVNPRAVNLTMTSLLELVAARQQAPAWLGAVVSGYVVHPLGSLVPDSTHDADDDDWPTFDVFVIAPVAECIYQAAEQVLAADDTVRVWADIRADLGPGETSGDPQPHYEIDYRTEAGGYDGFEAWGVGNVLARYIKQRIRAVPAEGVAAIRSFRPTVDKLTRAEGAREVAILAGGTPISFTQTFQTAPRVIVTVVSGTALFATAESITTIGFTCHVWDTDGADVGGTVNWHAEGI